MARAKAGEKEKIPKSREYVASSDDSRSQTSSGDNEDSEAADSESSSSRAMPRSEKESRAQAAEASTSENSASDISDERTTSKKRKSSSSEQVLDVSRKKGKQSNKKGPVATTPAQHSVPQGYSSLELDASDFALETGNLFEDLDGKQIWHITAPATTTITNIESLDISAALRGEPIFTDRDVSYNMFAASSDGEALLLPVGVGGVYAAKRVEISQNFHLRQVYQHSAPRKTVDLSEHVADNAESDRSEQAGSNQTAFFAQTEGRKKPARQQPPGLFMRYRPFGTVNSHSAPYLLMDPEKDENKENILSSSQQIVVPQLSSDGEGLDPSTPGQSKHDKRVKHKKAPSKQLSNGGHVEGSKSGFEDQTATPRSKHKSSKRKPDRKEKRQKVNASM